MRLFSEGGFFWWRFLVVLARLWETCEGAKRGGIKMGERSDYMLAGE